jgi:HD-like signal output (HDOD) protein
MELCNKETVTIQEVVKLVQSDSAIAGRLLQQANMSRNSSSRPSVSIGDAVQKLGLNTVRQFCLGFSLIDQYGAGSCKGFDYQGYWAHSVLMGILAHHLCAKIGIGNKDEMFVCALVSKIGMLSLATVYPDVYTKVINRSKQGSLTKREKEEFDIDHNEVTVSMVRSWGIPDDLVSAIAFHEIPEASNYEDGSRLDKLVRIINESDWLSNACFNRYDDQQTEDDGTTVLQTALDIKIDDMISILEAAYAAWDGWSDILKINIKLVPIRSLLASALNHEK